MRSNLGSAFGHGLSYTTFEIGTPSWDGTTLKMTVTNTGAVRGGEVVQVYVRDVEATVARPPDELKAFAKVWLDPGASKELSFELDERAFAFWDIDAHDWIVEPGEFELLVGTSSRNIHHRVTVQK